MLVRLVFALAAFVAISGNAAHAAPLTDQQFNALCPSERQAAIARLESDLNRASAARPERAASLRQQGTVWVSQILSAVRRTIDVTDTILFSPSHLAKINAGWDGAVAEEQSAALNRRNGEGEMEFFRLVKAYNHCAILARQNVLRPPAGAQNPPLAAGSAPVGKDLRAEVLAGDGTSAMGCVSLMDVAARDSSTSGGSRVLANRCSGTVAVFWCYVQPGGTCGEWGEWNIGVNNSWPVSREKEVRWGACLGGDTLILDKSRQGTRFACRAPQR